MKLSGRRYDNATETFDKEFIAIKKAHKCQACERTFPTLRGISRYTVTCSPDGPEKALLMHNFVEQNKLIKHFPRWHAYR